MTEEVFKKVEIISSYSGLGCDGKEYSVHVPLYLCFTSITQSALGTSRLNDFNLQPNTTDQPSALPIILHHSLRSILFPCYQSLLPSIPFTFMSSTHFPDMQRHANRAAVSAILNQDQMFAQRQRICPHQQRVPWEHSMPVPLVLFPPHVLSS